MSEKKIEFSKVVDRLNTRAHRAIVSQLGFREESLNKHLTDVLSRQPGEEGSLLADPVFEATFGYKTSAKTLKALTGDLIHEDLAAALDNPPQRYRSEYRFPMNRKPYAHQLKAWQSLMGEEPRSTLVTSGTGSGKTECFLIPILNDLAKERASSKEPIQGVRALFLYPLNALIKSQRDRLAAWTGPFDGDLRFCLYNGETPNSMPARELKKTPEEVRARRQLREDPPPILVTNGTMLEYMLVRQDDQPILAASQGKLRWIVLDEAHTYVGSQAAELALLLRRVMIAFGVSAKEVRFVATSATIGGEGAATKQKLAEFLADMAGVDVDDVTVIYGSRDVPQLGEGAGKALPLDVLLDASEELSWEQIKADVNCLELRKYASQVPRKLDALAGYAATRWHGIQKSELLRLLDRLSNVLDKSNRSFLPLRGHVFEKTFGGIWGCSNAKCSGKSAALSEESWPFGAIYFHQQDFCSHCHAPVYELTNCSACGTAYLEAEHIYGKDGMPQLRSTHNVVITDEFQLDIDLNDEDDEESDHEELLDRRLLGSAEDHHTDDLVCNDHTVTEPGEGDVAIRLLQHVSESGVRHLRCDHCGEAESFSRKLFLPKRLGAPFFLGDILPTVLEYCPPAKGDAAAGPSEGRRLLTFTDSRQGTARIAARLQQDTDRNYVRSIVYHSIAPVKSVRAEDSTQIAQTKEDLNKVEIELQSNADDPLYGPLLKKRKEELEKILALASGTAAEESTLSWEEVVEMLSKDDDIANPMRKAFNQTAATNLDQIQFAEYCLYREFARRPKRGAQSELLGLTKISYPKINEILKAPDEWLRHNGTLEEWKSFLTLLVDHFMRENSIVRIDDAYQRWMGARIRFKFVQPPGADRDRRRFIRPWPRCYRGNRNRNRLIDLLLHIFALRADEAAHCRSIDLIMGEAWAKLQLLMRQFPNGYQFDFASQVQFQSVTDAWICPYTRKIVPHTLRGYSPYTVIKPDRDPEKATLIQMPELPERFWSGMPNGVNAEDWIESNERVRQLRAQWVWPNRSDRAASMERWFAVGEHSAQQSTKRLEQLEDKFKKGQVNVLSCSTTMEMGVDIGGMSAVAMNNVPPSQANYLQRAGRAGRRNEAASLSVTLCKQTPHGLQVFENPLWPFDTSAIAVPRVPFESIPIVQRHLNALLLSQWLQRFEEDIPKLNCEWFFEEKEIQGLERFRRFSAWCESTVAQKDTGLLESVKLLLAGTVLSNLSLQDALAETVKSIQKIGEAWSREVDVFKRQLEAFTENEKGGESSPVVRAINRQLSVARKEYLLKELTSKGFLPGHGFPSGIVPLITTTRVDFAPGPKNEDGTREDQVVLSRGNPTRDRAVAIREFAPGADVVIDGAVFQAGGITLNWHIPAEAEGPPENLPDKWFWFCRACGSGNTSQLLAESCASCGSSNLAVNRLIEPNGFAVDLNYEAHNDINTPTYLKFHPPRIVVSEGQPMSLPNERLGYFRYSDFGQALTYNKGPHDCGYAVCLYCGRTEAQQVEGQVPDGLYQHRRLRGGRANELESHCPGSENDWAIRQDVWLAGEDRTSVLELRLRNATTESAITDELLAWSVAYALRHGLVSALGIGSQEVSIAVQDADDPKLGPIKAIYLYDTATSGAGYVATLTSQLSTVVQNALELLDCGADCDAACHSCLMDWDSQHQAELLDRHLAMEFLAAWQGYLELPESLKALGPNTQAQLVPIAEGLRTHFYKGRVEQLRLFVGGESDNWDIMNWVLLQDVLRWIDEKCHVCLVAPKGTFASLPAEQKRTLAALAELGGGALSLQETAIENRVDGDIKLVAQSLGNENVFWATDSPILEPGSNWGFSQNVLFTSDARVELPCEAIILKEALINGTDSVPGAIPLVIKGECDGSLENFGNRFWGVIKSQAELDVSGKVIRELTYSDRYLVTPLHGALLYQLLKPIAEIFDDAVNITLNTAEIAQDNYRRSPVAVNDNWSSQPARDQVFRGLVEDLAGRSVKLNAKPKRELPHSRSLELFFDDHTKVTIYLDEGVGCWRAGYSKFEFAANVNTQIRTLKQLDSRIRIAHQSLGTNLFVLKG